MKTIESYTDNAGFKACFELTFLVQNSEYFGLKKVFDNTSILYVMHNIKSEWFKVVMK